MTELNGRPAAKFEWLISERQFQVVHCLENEDPNDVMAESSSMTTLCKCVEDMLRLAPGHGKRDIRVAISIDSPVDGKRKYYDRDGKCIIQAA